MELDPPLGNEVGIRRHPRPRHPRDTASPPELCGGGLSIERVRHPFAVDVESLHAPLRAASSADSSRSLCPGPADRRAHRPAARTTAETSWEALFVHCFDEFWLEQAAGSVDLSGGTAYGKGI